MSIHRLTDGLYYTLTFIFTSLPFGKAYAEELSVNRSYSIYKVEAGDNLWKISQKFQTSITAIRNLNNLTTDILDIGQPLKVPSNANTSVLYYTVQAGDTLWEISQRMGVTTWRIMNDNGLSSTMLYIGQMLKINYKNPVITVNYMTGSGDTIWALSQRYKTSIDSIIKSNYMRVDYLMPGQIITIPLESEEIVKPIGIDMLKAKSGVYYGDIYTWENARRLLTVGTDAVIKDVATGITWKVRYYGGSNHADIVTLTKEDTDKMYRAFGYKWSWNNKRPMVLFFSQGGVAYQLSCSLIGMPHSTTNIIDNGMVGHCCLYFYNSIGHSNPRIDPVSQFNILKANGQ